LLPSTVKPKVVFPMNGSIRPPPVIRTQPVADRRPWRISADVVAIGEAGAVSPSPHPVPSKAAAAMAATEVREIRFRTRYLLLFP
jgi:hypothetical protein